MVRAFLVVLAVLGTACHPRAATPPRPVSAQVAGPAILAPVPADTPYVVGVIESPPEDVRTRMFGQVEAQMKQVLAQADALAQQDPASLTPGQRVMVAFAAELRGKDLAHWSETLGFAPLARFVIYGLSLWPVMRIGLADASHLRGVVGRLVAASGSGARPQPTAGGTYWTFAAGAATLVVAVLEREAVAAVVPTSVLDAALPFVLGTRQPRASLRDSSRLTELEHRHQFLPTMVGFLDMHRFVEALAGGGQGEMAALDRPVGALATPACRSDLDRIASVTPLLAFGYRALDASGFTARVVLETPPAITRSLGQLRSAMPSMPLSSRPLFALGAAVKLDEALRWLRDVAGAIQARPFTCGPLAALDTAAEHLAQQLDRPLPPMLHGLRGVELVVDDATTNPPSGSGHLLVIGAHVPALVTDALKNLPGIGALPLHGDGVPVALPLDRLGVPSLPPAHLAMQADRVVIAVGQDSAARTRDRLAAPASSRAPLVAFGIDVPRFGALVDDKEMSGLKAIRDLALVVDVTAEGVVADMVGTWAAPAN